jgi:hypothetical protein
MKKNLGSRGRNRRVTGTLTVAQWETIDGRLRMERDFLIAIDSPKTAVREIDRIVQKIRDLPIKFDYPKNGRWRMREER